MKCNTQQKTILHCTRYFFCKNTKLDSTSNEKNLTIKKQGANYKKILRLSYDVIITYDNRKSNLR